MKRSFGARSLVHEIISAVSGTWSRNSSDVWLSLIVLRRLKIEKDVLKRIRDGGSLFRHMYIHTSLTLTPNVIENCQLKLGRQLMSTSQSPL